MAERGSGVRVSDQERDSEERVRDAFKGGRLGFGRVENPEEGAAPGEGNRVRLRVRGRRRGER